MIKRLLKLFISIFWFFILRIKLRIFHRGIPIYVIIYYHSVALEQLPKFKKQLDFFSRYTNIIPLNKFDYIDKRKINLSITFDDALLSVLENAQPELLKRQIPFTVFVPTGHLGKIPTWEVDNKEKRIIEPVMSIEQIKQLNNKYCVLGSHSVSHKNLTLISLLEARKELKNSKDKLEEILDKKIEFFSFPYGAYNQSLIDIAKEVGYKSVYTIDTSFAKSINTFDSFGRISVSFSDSFFELYLKICGAYNWVSIFQRKKYSKYKSEIS